MKYELLSRGTKIRLIKSFTDMLMKEDINVFGLNFVGKSDDDLNAILAGMVSMLEAIEENKNV